MLTKITIEKRFDNLFVAVLVELPCLCNFFTCHPKDKVFVVHSDTFRGDDFLDELRARNLITDHMKAVVME